MNRYGHPHEELLERLKRSGAEVMITKESGAITIKTDGSKMEVWDYTSSMEGKQGVCKLCSAIRRMALIKHTKKVYCSKYRDRAQSKVHRQVLDTVTYYGAALESTHPFLRVLLGYESETNQYYYDISNYGMTTLTECPNNQSLFVFHHLLADGRGGFNMGRYGGV